MKATGKKTSGHLVGYIMEFVLTLLKIKRTNGLRRIIVSLSNSIRPLCNGDCSYVMNNRNTIQSPIIFK